jgi:hypothetical protein
MLVASTAAISTHRNIISDALVRPTARFVSTYRTKNEIDVFSWSCLSQLWQEQIASRVEIDMVSLAFMITGRA